MPLEPIQRLPNDQFSRLAGIPGFLGPHVRKAPGVLCQQPPGVNPLPGPDHALGSSPGGGVEDGFVAAGSRACY